MNYSEKYFTPTTVKQNSVFKVYIAFLKKHGISLEKQLICDVGCATGAFINELSINNTCFGTDISEFAIESCKKVYSDRAGHFAVHDINSSMLPFLEKFNIIALFDVIEHLRNFSFFQKIISEQLSNDGCLVITTPNANSFTRFVSDKLFTGEIDPTHTILFTPFTLHFFLKRLGLQRVAMCTPYSFYFNDDTITRHLPFGGQIFAIYRKR